MKTLCIAIALLLLSFGLAFGSGDADDKKVTAGDVKKETKEAAETAAQYGKQKQEEWSKDLAAKWAALQEEGQELYKKAQDKAAQGQEKYRQIAKNLAEKRDKAMEKLKAVHQASKDNIAQAKEELKQAVDQLKEAYKNAKAELTD